MLDDQSLVTAPGTPPMAGDLSNWLAAVPGVLAAAGALLGVGAMREKVKAIEGTLVEYGKIGGQVTALQKEVGVLNERSKSMRDTIEKVEASVGRMADRMMEDRHRSH